jgi:hypothetical protein
MKYACPVALAGFVALFAPTARAAEEGFKPLFDGKTLSGWHGDGQHWTVADGVIVGSTDATPIRKNNFLSTEKSYANFVLRLKFKLRNGNSGVQFRSRQLDDYVVRGYQADIADKTFMGILYDEGGTRGILHNVNEREVKQHLKPNDWNEYVITADGPHITQAINGFTTVDYTERDPKAAKEGIIALQLHVGPKMQVMFKDIEIKELP